MLFAGNNLIQNQFTGTRKSNATVFLEWLTILFQKLKELFFKTFLTARCKVLFMCYPCVCVIWRRATWEILSWRCAIINKTIANAVILLRVVQCSECSSGVRPVRRYWQLSGSTLWSLNTLSIHGVIVSLRLSSCYFLSSSPSSDVSSLKSYLLKAIRHHYRWTWATSINPQCRLLPLHPIQ